MQLPLCFIGSSNLKVANILIESLLLIVGSYDMEININLQVIDSAPNSEIGLA